MAPFEKLVAEAEELIRGGGDVMLLHEWAYHGGEKCNCEIRMSLETLPNLDPDRERAYRIAYDRVRRA